MIAYSIPPKSLSPQRHLDLFAFFVRYGWELYSYFCGGRFSHAFRFLDLRFNPLYHIILVLFCFPVYSRLCVGAC